jgi:tetratricopeptide (TPR) repeat protein
LSNQYGNNFPRIATALNNLGRVLRNKGRYSESQGMQEKALDLLRKVHGENHPHVATALYNLGILLCLQEKYSDAIIQIKASLDRRKVVFNETNPLIYDTMRILSYLSYLEGSYLQSRSYLEECLKIKTRNQFSLNDKNEIAMLLNNLGLVLKGLLIYSEAEEVLKESLKIRFELFSSSHETQQQQQTQQISLATSYYTLGRLYLSMRRFQEAKEFLLNSQSLREGGAGGVGGGGGGAVGGGGGGVGHHPSIANILHSLSELAQSQGLLVEAVDYMNEVIEIRTQLYGESHILVLGSLSRLLTLYKLTNNEIEIEKLEQKIEKIEQGTSVRRSEEDSSIALLMLLDGFEDSTDGILFSNSTSQFIKMDLVNQSKSLENKLYSNENDMILLGVDGATKAATTTTTGTAVSLFGEEGKEELTLTTSGGKDWTDHLLIYLTKKSEMISQELHEKETLYHEKKTFIEKYENEIHSHTTLYHKLVINEKELEKLLNFDKRYFYDLQKVQQELENLKLKLNENEMTEKLCELHEEEKKYQQVIEMIEKKLQDLNFEIQKLEILNRQYKEIVIRIQDLENSLTNQRQGIEKLKYEIIQQEIDEENEKGGTQQHDPTQTPQLQTQQHQQTQLQTQQQQQQQKEGIIEQGKRNHLKQKLYELIHEKQIMETDYELIQIQYFKIMNQLNTVRKKYNIMIPSDSFSNSTSLSLFSSTVTSPHSVLSHSNFKISLQSTIPSSSSTSLPSSSHHVLSIPSNIEKKKKRGDSFLLNDCDDLSETDELDDLDDGPASSDQEDEGKGISSSKLKKLSKRVKKQRLLIDLLTNQVVSLGAAPIAEVVTLVSAEQRLQQSLVKLMEGDEEAAKDFDKWDQFVRNHPEFKQKEEMKKERWKVENTPVNVIASRWIKSMIPPDIILSCTLAMLETQLPKLLAKRIWSKKALWLTRVSPMKISRLHIADLQSKYSPQGLDEIELRAIYHALPLSFENDGKGEKMAWKGNILESLQSKSRNPLPWAEKYETESHYEPTQDEIVNFLMTLSRNPAYK